MKIQPLEEENFSQSFKFFKDFKYDNCPQNGKNQETIFQATSSLQNSQVSQTTASIKKPHLNFIDYEDLNKIKRQNKHLRVVLQH